MAKTRSKGGKKGRNNSRKPRPNRMAKAGGNAAIAAALQWRRLLADPCTGDLAYPCYSGVDSGYLIRTVDTFSPTAAGTFTVNGNTTLDFVFAYTPSNTSTNTGFKFACTTAGGIFPSLSTDGPDNFITNAAVVRGYRPVAACLKFVPVGAIQARSGEVGTGYMPDTIDMTVSTTVSAFMSLTQRRAANGEEPHEINWLPTAADENFTTFSYISDPGCGTNFIVARGIDAKGISVTAAVVSGYVEMTTIWEWTPVVSILGVAADPKAPNPYNSQQIIASAGDIKSLLNSGVQRAVSSLGNGVAGAAMRYARRTFMGISNPSARMFGESLPRIMY